MKKGAIILIFIVLAIVLIILGTFYLGGKDDSSGVGNMRIKSVFNEGGRIPAKYTCDGDDVNPELQISDIPAGTKSLVLVVDDPDAPAGTWTHWVVFNINPQSDTIYKNSVPAGAREGKNSWGNLEWQGPCPPSGEHRYRFKLFALDEELDLQEGALNGEVVNAMSGKVLEQTQLMGLYSRS